MDFRTAFLAFIFCIVFTTSGCGQTQTYIPKEFTESNIPIFNSNEWRALNNSPNEFGVSIINGTLAIKKVKEINRNELKIEKGTLIGLNRGEWGGQLTFKPSDSSKKTIVIKEGNIKFIFKFNNKIYFIEGLAHMNYSGGAMYELNTTGDQFKYTQVLDFEDAPEAFTIFKDKFLIATHNNFYIVQNLNKTLVFKNIFWDSLYPNSIAVFDDKHVFIGIRGGIVMLDTIDKKIKFYKYKG